MPLCDAQMLENSTYNRKLAHVSPDKENVPAVKSFHPVEMALQSLPKDASVMDQLRASISAQEKMAEQAKAHRARYPHNRIHK